MNLSRVLRKALFVQSQTVINQVKINNTVSGIANCWKINPPELHYTNKNQSFDETKIREDRKIIRMLKKHPVFIVNGYFKHPLN